MEAFAWIIKYIRIYGDMYESFRLHILLKISGKKSNLFVLTHGLSQKNKKQRWSKHIMNSWKRPWYDQRTSVDLILQMPFLLQNFAFDLEAEN
jgi:hypothetical protein